MKLIYFILLVGFTLSISAQEKLNLINSTNIKRCGFKQANPNLTPEVLSDFQTFISKYDVSKRNSRIENGILIIPVVVHIIHNGDAIGQNENLSDTRIQSQIEVLNQDYRRMFNTPGYNTNPVGADFEIEFRLATTKQDGTATNGINRVNFGVDEFITYNQTDNMKSQTYWDPENYMNIWVVNFTSTFDGDDNTNDLLGYAQFPNNSNLTGLNSDEGGATTDGVVINWKAFGNVSKVSGTYFNNYNKGRTVTHEVGHYLGLLHTFDDNEQSCIENDFCNDTPIQKTSSTSCALKNSCPSNPGNDMVENYMDYSYDTCMNTFTQDQKNRIWQVLNTASRRKNLKNTYAFGDKILTSENITIIPNYSTPNYDLENIKIILKEIGNAEIKIHDTYGSLIYTKNYSGLEFNLELGFLSTGIYFISVDSASGKTKTKIFKK